MEVRQDLSCCSVVKDQEENSVFNFPLFSPPKGKKDCWSCCLTSHSLPVGFSRSVVGDKEL